MELRIDNQLDEKTEIIIRNIIGAAIDVHRELGPGYLEKVYEQAMALELRYRGLAYATQVSVAVHYKGEKIHGQILDMVVEGKVYRNNLKNRFLAASVFSQNFHAHSRLASRQWSLAPHRKCLKILRNLLAKLPIFQIVSV